MKKESQAQPVIGILLDDGFDDWLNTLGISLEAFTRDMMGSWVFNYIQALQKVGVRSVLFCVSTQVGTPTRMTHSPTGVTIVLLPPPKIYQLVRLVRGWLSKHPDAAAEPALHGSRDGVIQRVKKAIVSHIESYLATPLIVLFRELQREGCRSLLVQEYESARFDVCVLWGRLKRVRVFGTFTGGLPTPWFSRPLRRLALHFCAGLAIGARQEAKRVMVDYQYPEDRLVLAYSSVDLDIYYPRSKESARRELGIDIKAKLAMYHGAINLAYKGLDVLLEAWRLVCQNLPDRNVRLILIGTGSDAEEFSHLLSTQRLQGVEWFNQWVHDRDPICRYLSSADVYVFPSRGDACPNAVIEAMACGLPIVASKVSGIADILEGGEDSGGVLVPPADAPALALALGRLLDNEGLSHDIGLRARCRAERCFSMDVLGKQLRGLLAD